MTTVSGRDLWNGDEWNDDRGGPSRWGSGTSAQQRKAQQAWERANVPYSFKVGNTFVPFDRFPEPLATLMRLTADMGAASAYMTEEEKDGAFGTLVGVGAAGLTTAQC